ncbi:DUF7218 family protein [Nesterenkonia suensis]
MARDRIKDEELYERLRDDGEPKEKAARIANQAAREGRSDVGAKGGDASNYEHRTVEQLRERVKELGMTGYSDMTKDELIRQLRRH